MKAKSYRLKAPKFHRFTPTGIIYFGTQAGYIISGAAILSWQEINQKKGFDK
jgi:hypothetical protein